MKKDFIFPSELWSTKIDNFQDINNSLIHYVYKLYNHDKIGSKKSNIGGWHSHYLNTYEDEKVFGFNEIVNIISENINQLNDYSEFKKDVWVNINGKDAHNLTHHHHLSEYSGVYYIKSSKDSGNLILLDPYGFYIKKNKSNVKILEHSIKPEEGMLYIFRGWLPHKVEKNISDDDRISISFNFSKPKDRR